MAEARADESDFKAALGIAALFRPAGEVETVDVMLGAWIIARMARGIEALTEG